MASDFEQPRRRSIRLKEYDYSQAGAYFITICTHDKKCLFGDVHDGIMRLNELGKIAASYWNEIPNHFQNVELDAFIVMPNHIHGIILINDDGRGTACRAPTKEEFGKPKPHSLATIIRSYKSAVTKHISRIRKTPSTPLWHRNYYEHIIRNEKSLEQIRNYIEYNASKWETDEENPKNLQ